LKNRHISYKRVIIGVISFALVLALISITIGREIYGEKESGLLWFAFIHFLGYLFFLLMPVEMAFIYYLPDQESAIIIFLVAMGTAVVAQLIDYYIGYSVSHRVINKLIGEKRYKKAEGKIEQHGNWVIFVFNLLPLSSPIIALAAGMVKHPMSQFLLYSVSGLFLKYLVLVLIVGS